MSIDKRGGFQYVDRVPPHQAQGVAPGDKLPFDAKVWFRISITDDDGSTR